MTESIKELILANKIKRPSYKTIINWINNSLICKITLAI